MPQWLNAYEEIVVMFDHDTIIGPELPLKARSPIIVALGNCAEYKYPLVKPCTIEIFPI